MTVADVQVSSGLITALVPVCFVMAVGLITWIVRELSRISNLLSRIDERVDSLERAVFK
jgi:hypothetical protein